jgi:hypothetical protein
MRDLVRTSLLWLTLAATASCGLFTGPDSRTFPVPRTYAFDFFETREECLAHQPPDFFINCSQIIDFFPDGRVEMMVTDIINPGSYEIRGQRVTLRFEGTPELPPKLELDLSADERTLTEVSSGKVWVLRQP